MARASEAEKVLVKVFFHDEATGIESQWPWDELDRVIEIESGWDPTARNPKSNATGLIQWSVRNLKRWKVTPNQVRNFPLALQAPMVKRWFDEKEREGAKWRVPGDTYLAVAAPAHTGAPDDRIIYPVGTKAWRDNELWRPKTHPSHITAGSIRALMLRRRRRAKKNDLPVPKRKKKPRVRRAALGMGALGILMVLALIFGGDQRRRA